MRVKGFEPIEHAAHALVRVRVYRADWINGVDEDERRGVRDGGAGLRLEERLGFLAGMIAKLDRETRLVAERPAWGELFEHFADE